MFRFLVVLALLLAAVPAYATDDYKLGPDSQGSRTCPKGKVTKHIWKSKIFRRHRPRLLGLRARPSTTGRSRPA